MFQFGSSKIMFPQVPYKMMIISIYTNPTIIMHIQLILWYTITSNKTEANTIQRLQDWQRVKKVIHDEKSRIELANCHYKRLLMQAAYKKLLHELHPTLLRALS